jgi:hypothetical protein
VHLPHVAETCQARRLSLLTVDANEAWRPKDDQPAVQAGLYEIEVFTWMVPSGAWQFGPASSPARWRRLVPRER